MLSINTIEINKLTDRQLLPSTSKTALDIRSVVNKTTFNDEFKSICQQHRHVGKWILMIGPENKSLSDLHRNRDIDASNVLCIHSNKVKVTVDSISRVLKAGNCSAIVIHNSGNFLPNLCQLTEAANQSNMPCIILTNDESTTETNLLH